jgi:hypothetical protein
MAIGSGNAGSEEIGVMRTTMADREGRGARWVLVAMLAPGLWLAPAASRADDDPVPFATIKAYEVQEATDLRGNPQNPALRLANASIVGTASGGLCTAGQDPCAFDTMATSRIPLLFGVGPLGGSFQVMFDTLMNPGHLLSDLVLIAKGSIHGTLDLRPLLNRTAPMALMKGQWKSKMLGVRGTFSGTFLVPFPDPTKQCATGFAYLDPAAGLQCLEPTEISLGRPVTKVVATFLKTGACGPDDEDDDFDAAGRGRLGR